MIAIVPAMTLNTKTGIDEMVAEAVAMVVLPIRFHLLYDYHVGDLSFCYRRKFFWEDKGWEYDFFSVQGLG